MLLTVDVGNTNITAGCFDGDKLVANFRINTKIDRTSDEYGITFMQFLYQFAIDPTNVNDIIICSVVPRVLHSLTNAFIKYFNTTPLIIGPGIKTGIQLKMDNPKEVGADRIATVVAAHALYPCDVMVIDFGTATTFDYVSASGEFTYTVIAPGPQIAANALWSQTAKLPEIEIVKCESILAKNTISGMQVGIYYGYIGLVEKIIETMKKDLKLPDLKIIATGGLGRLFFSQVSQIEAYDPDLIFKGMKILYDKNSGSKD